MRGDLLFWTSDGSPVSRLISVVTRGPFVHVSVDMGDGTDISAHAEDGVKERVVVGYQGLTHWSPQVSEEAIDRGIDFLKGEIGDKYGFCNILNAGLAALHLPYRVTRLDRYDCSSLVTRYLTEIGVDLKDELGEEPDSVSPNDLARSLGVIGVKAARTSEATWSVGQK